MERHSHRPSPRLGLLWVVFLAELTSMGNVPCIGGDPNFLLGGPPDVGFVSMRWRSFKRRKRDGHAPGRYRVRLR
eukprot:6904954-Ditylum_brightwellii.AAC.1